ncbi:G-patch domain [Macleaya cordata]|uniref:G-patch domain n=1 Tax=Macleaya cordata TaxID=56857 RepID=A0A200QWF9_MACCD|nr:G-patch domain [Macleaya cordata]
MADDPIGTGTSGATTTQTIDEMIRASLARVLREDLNTLLEKIVTEKLASQSPSSKKTPTPSKERNINEGQLQRLEGSTIYDVNSWYQSPEEQLPPKFKYPEITKYDGSGPPKAHIMMYMGCMKPMGISDNMLAHLFQMSLVGNSLEWFVELDRSKYPTWPMLADAFIKHFSYGGDTRVTRRQLEAMQQGPNESFTDYIARWRRKVREMIDRPSEEEQIAIIRKNLRPKYHKVMSVVTKTRLDKFIQVGTQVEDSLKNETSTEPKGKKTGKEHVNYISNGQGQHRPFQVQLNRPEQNNQQNQRPQAHQTNQGNPQGNQGNGRNRPNSEFSKLNHPMSMLLVGLLEAGLVTHKPPVRAPKTPQAWYNPDQYCSFHQSPGHLTDNCWALKHEIQNLLDSGKIFMEGVQVPRKPNINTNPLPNHQMEGQKSVNYVGTEEPVDPTKLIRRRETTEVATVYSAQPDRSSEYQLGESSQRPLTLSKLAARGKKLELERQWPIPVPETNPVMKEQPKKTLLFTINQRTPIGFEIMQEEKIFKIEELLKPPIDLKESLIPKNQGHVWTDPFKSNSESVEDCQEVQHQTRAGKIFKPVHLRIDIPAATARGPLFQMPSGKPREEEDKVGSRSAPENEGQRVSLGDVDEAQEMANHKGKNVIPIIEPVGTLCNYTEEAINVLQVRPMIREKIPSRFEYGNRRAAYLLQKHRFFPGMGLGRCHQGITQPLRSRAAAPEGTYGLGYSLTKEEIHQSRIGKGKKAQVRNMGEPCISSSIDWSKQPKYSEWFVKKGHGTVVPTLSKKSSVTQKEAMIETTEEVEAPDDTLLTGISLLYSEAESEREAVPSINIISDESELDDTATPSQRRMTTEEYIASKTQWANATEYRAAFFHPKKQRSEVEYLRHPTTMKKRMTAAQYREVFQSARKKKITSTLETNTRCMSADAYRISFRQANMSVTPGIEAEMVRNTAE